MFTRLEFCFRLEIIFCDLTSRLFFPSYTPTFFKRLLKPLIFFPTLVIFVRYHCFNYFNLCLYRCEIVVRSE